MLICYDCENELRNEYLEKVKKDNGNKYTIENQHSRIKRKLLDEDNNSRLSRESYFTDNNSYIPNNYKYNRNQNIFDQNNKKGNFNKIKKNLSLEEDKDKLSIHSYNGIITDYSTRRKKNKIKNNKKENEELPINYSNKREEEENNYEKNIQRKIDNNNINNEKNKEELNNNNNYEFYKNRDIISQKDNEIIYNDKKELNKSEKGNRYSKEEKESISPKKEKENIFNKDDYINNNEEEKEEDENEDNNWNANSNSFLDINKNIEQSKEKNSLINNKFDSFAPKKEKEKNNLYEQDKSSKMSDISDKKDFNYNKEKNIKNNPFDQLNKKKSIDKNKNYDDFDERKINSREFNSEKDFNKRYRDYKNEKNEEKSESDGLYDSILYERCGDNNILNNEESKYIKRNKNNNKSKNKNEEKKYNIINKESKEEDFEISNNDNKEQSLSYKEQTSPEKSYESNDKMKYVVFNNRYINNNYRNDVTQRYNEDMKELKNKKILYQDFYYKEISYSPGSSIRSSINSQSNSSDNYYNVNTSYPEDGRRDRIKRNTNKIIEPDNEFDKYIFEQINIIRSNPKSFIEKIESAKKNISVNKRNNYIYNGKQKILLNNGIYAFDNAIKHLAVLRNMEKLKYNPKLNIKLPSNEDEINDRQYQIKKVEELINNKIKIKSFWREIIKDPEECLLLMIIDDCGNNCGVKRKDLLDPRITSIGINSIKIGKYFACYIQLK